MTVRSIKKIRLNKSVNSIFKEELTFLKYSGEVFKGKCRKFRKYGIKGCYYLWRTPCKKGDMHCDFVEISYDEYERRKKIIDNGKKKKRR